MKKIFAISFVALAALMAGACGSTSTSGDTAGGKTIKSGPAGNNLTATLSSSDGVMRKGKQNFTLAFTDASGKAVDVGSVALNFHMPAMGTMAVMNNPAAFVTTATPGVYQGTTNLEMGGEWQAQISYEGPVGTGKGNLTIVAQ